MRDQDRVDKRSKDPTTCINNIFSSFDNGSGSVSTKSDGDIGMFGSSDEEVDRR